MPPAAVPLRLLLFATARTAVGVPRLDWPVPAEGRSADLLLADVVRQYPALRRILRGSRLFLNGEPLADPAARVGPGDELAVHPPYGGG